MKTLLFVFAVIYFTTPDGKENFYYGPAQGFMTQAIASLYACNGRGCQNLAERFEKEPVVELIKVTSTGTIYLQFHDPRRIPKSLKEKWNRDANAALIKYEDPL